MSSDPATLEGLRIARPSPARRQTPSWIAPTVIAAIVIIAGGWWWIGHRTGKTEVATAPVQTLSAGASTAPQTLLNASGYVTARRSATVSSKVTGKVVEVNVEEGKRVAEGDVLARLDSSNVEASLHLAEAQLESARRVAAETKPNLDFAESELKRFQNLASSQVVSDSDFRRTEMEAKGMTARLARQTAEIDVAERQVAQWQQQLDDMTIRAPFGGIVTSKNAQPGEMISPMSVGGFTRTGICTIVDMSSLEIEVDVNESFIKRVTPGQPVQATLDAYPDWEIPCQVIAIIPTADRQKATVKVRVGFDEVDERILPEMAVKVAFQSGDEANEPRTTATLSVPKSAVQNVDGRDIVWIVREGRVERRAVTVNGTTGDQALIAAGVRAGENVVVDPPTDLADGAAVSEKKP